MTANIGAFEIIHARTPEIAIGKQKSTGLDDVDAHPQTGAQPHQTSRILGNVGLIQRKAHVFLLSVPVLLDKWRQDKAFSASSCRKTLENRLSILPAQRTSGAGRVTASVPCPRLFVARVCIVSFQVFLKGGPSGSYDK
jgi:hypothetical protein